uniref:claudin domain-containing protein 2 isoform X1 n=1 Tax=Halichoerus grypus TaxID=9711 RepID=UPI001658D101|nr:claudin domain-containing protein 2 isoform X1 [Halichoerus grypus]
MAEPAPTSPARVRPCPPRCPPLDRQPPAQTTAGHMLRRPHPRPFHSSLRSTCSPATETTTNPHLGTYFPVATLTAPHEVTSKFPSKPSTLLPAPYRRVGVVARAGASAGLRRPLSPAMLAVTGACMVLAAASGIVGLVMGLRILCHEGDSRGQTTSGIFFLYGLLLLIALTGYTVKNAWKNDVFFSWSYFSGWLALPFSIFAGNLDSGKRVEETAQRSPFPADSQPPSQGLLNTLRSRLPQTRQGRPWGPKPQSPGRSRPSAPGPTVPHPPSAPLPPGFSFLLADMIMQSTDAISGFPVCL